MAHEFHCERFLKAFSVVNNHKAAVQFRFSSTISKIRKTKAKKYSSYCGVRIFFTISASKVNSIAAW